MIINEDWRIETDDLNYKLQRRFKKKDETYDFKDVAYTNSIQAALKVMVDREIKGSGFDDFNSIVSKIDELKEIINNLNI